MGYDPLERQTAEGSGMSLHEIEVCAVGEMVEVVDEDGLGPMLADLCTTKAEAFGHKRQYQMSRDLARRIAACWNICTGASTEELEAAVEARRGALHHSEVPF